LIVAAAALAGTLAAFVVLPGFVNWTPYRDTFAVQLGQAVGRPVSIQGVVDFTLLPRPALRASEVTVTGAVPGDSIIIGQLSARLAFAPLLRGAFQFRDLRLEDSTAIITLGETWPPFASPAAHTDASIPRADGGEAFQVDIEGIEVAGGALTLRNANGGVIALAHEIEMRVRVAARDAYVLEGDAVVGGTALGLELRVSAAGSADVRAVSATVRLHEAAATFGVSGRFDVAARTLDGDFTASGPRAAPVFSVTNLLNMSAPPAALLKPFAVGAKVSADETGIAFSGLAVNLGGTLAQGTAEWREARTPQLTLGLDFAPVPLEDWRFAVAGTAARTASGAASSRPDLTPARVKDRFTADVSLRLPALSYRGRDLRDGRIAASLSAGEFRITDAAVTLPGTTRVSAFGLVNRADGPVVLDGVVNVQTYDARGLLSWLGLDVVDVPPGRLGSASFQAALQMAGDRLMLSDIAATLDTAQLAGRMSWAFGARPFVGIDLTADNINIDSYRPAKPALHVLSAPQPAKSAPPKPEVYGVTPTGTAFAGLANFDADFHLQMNGVTAGGIPGGRIGLDFALQNGALAIRTAAFEQVAAATAWFSGNVTGLGGALAFDNLQFELAGEDIARIADVAGWGLGPALQGLGAIALNGTLNGSAVQADVRATARVAGLTARVAGQLMDLDKAARFAGTVEAAHPRFSQVMSATPYGWPAGVRDPGPFALTVRMAHDPARTVVNEFRVGIGKEHFSATGEIADVDGRRRVTATLSDIAFNVDAVLPSRPAAKTTAATSAATPGDAAAIAGWLFLRGWDGEIALAGSSLTTRGLALQDFSARIAVADGAAELADWKGRIFGAPGQLFLRMASTPTPTLQGQIAVTRGDFRNFVAALNGGRTTLKSTGTTDLVASFTAQGPSADAMLRSLSGSGTLKITAVESGGGLSAGLFGPLTAAAQLDMTSPGNPAPITLSMRPAAANGRIKLEEIDVASRTHTGRFTGAVDLSGRQVDVSGTLTPRAAGQDALLISIKGAIDRPNIRLLPPAP